MIDPKGLSREPSSRPARESCMSGYESAKETLRVSDDGEIVARIETEHVIVHGNRELICFVAREEKVKKDDETPIRPSETYPPPLPFGHLPQIKNRFGGARL